MMNRRGRDVPMDHFLYSCFEYEQTFKAMSEYQQDELRWPLMDGCVEEISPEHIDSQSLEDLFLDMAAWYKAQYDALAGPGPIQYEILSDLVQPIVVMGMDLERLIKYKTKTALPLFDKKAESHPQIWYDLEKYFHQHFPDFADAILTYMQWSYAVDVEEKFDLAQRPPVGKFAPRRSDSRSRGSSDRGPRGNDRNARSDRGPRGNDRGGRGGNDRGSRGNDRGGRGGNDRGPRGKGKGDFGNKKDPKKERDVVKDVLLAVQELNDNPDAEFVRLSPQNSFYRRLQHEQAKKEGLASSSDGEGKERAVVIHRDAES